MAIIAAITNYNDLRDNLLTKEERQGLKVHDGYEETTWQNNAPLYLIDRKNYAVLTPSEKLAKRLTKLGAGLDTKIGKEQGARLLASDVGTFVRMDLITKAYAAQIKAGKEQVKKGLKQTARRSGERVPEALVGDVAADDRSVVPDAPGQPGLPGDAGDSPYGSEVPRGDRFSTGQHTVQLLKQSKVSTLKGIENLPAGQTAYYGIQYSPLIIKVLGSYLAGVAGSEQKEVNAALQELWQAGPDMLLGGTALPPVAGFAEWDYKEPAKAIAAQIKLLESLEAGQTWGGWLLKEKPRIQAGAKKYGRIEFTKVVVVWNLDKMVSNAGGGDLPKDARKRRLESIKKTVGDSVTYWLGTDGKRVLQVTAPDWTNAEKLLDRYLKQVDTVGSDSSFQNVRKELPEETSILFMVDLVKYVATMVDSARPPLEMAIPLPKDYPPAPRSPATFVGEALTAQANQASLDLFLSVAAMKSAYETFVAPLLPKQ